MMVVSDMYVESLAFLCACVVWSDAVKMTPGLQGVQQN
jgi:hypothetical protein